MLKKTPEQIEIMREGGKRLADVLDEVQKAVVSGITTGELDNIAEKLIRKGGDVPSFLGYRPDGAATPFPATLCTSVNNEVVHGIPGDKVLKEGDIIGIDLGLCRKGFHVDMARTVAVGEIDECAKNLISVTKKSLDAAIASIKPGMRTGDIGVAIEKVVNPSGFSIVLELGGHGIGERVHEDPYVPNFADPGKGVVLEEGIVLAIEPIVNEGGEEIDLGSDGYTFTTKDGKRSAHFEHTIAITKNGTEILTK